jgi:hypothetical protein
VNSPKIIIVRAKLKVGPLPSGPRGREVRNNRKIRSRKP